LLDISFKAEPGYPYLPKPGGRIDTGAVLRNYSFYLLSLSNNTGRDATLIDFLLQLPFPISDYDVLTTKFSEGLSFQPKIATMYPAPGSTVSTNGKAASHIAQLSKTRIRPGGKVTIRIELYQRTSMLLPVDPFIDGWETIGLSNKKEVYAPFTIKSDKTALLGNWSERPKKLIFLREDVEIIPPTDTVGTQ
jgi:hypothetical protein